MAKIRTIDGDVVVGIHIDFDIKCPNKPLFGREKFEERLKRKACKLYNKVANVMKAGTISEFNEWFDALLPDFNETDASEHPLELELYDDGLSGRITRRAEVQEDSMILVKVDCHTATYTFFDEPTGALVVMHVGKIQPIGEENNYDL